MARAAHRGADAVSAGAAVARQGARRARVVTRAGGDADGEEGRGARGEVASQETQEAAREAAQGAAGIGGAMMTLLSEQTRHAMQTTATIGRARTLSEIAAAQSDFVGGSVRRMGQMNDRYLAFVRAGMASMTPSSPRR